MKTSHQGSVRSDLGSKPNITNSRTEKEIRDKASDNDPYFNLAGKLYDIDTNAL